MADIAHIAGLVATGLHPSPVPFADFVLFHITTPTIHFNWYVFNYADTAIVAGVAGLLYESLFRDSAAKAPRSGS